MVPSVQATITAGNSSSGSGGQPTPRERGRYKQSKSFAPPATSGIIKRRDSVSSGKNSVGNREKTPPHQRSGASMDQQMPTAIPKITQRSQSEQNPAMMPLNL